MVLPENSVVIPKFKTIQLQNFREEQRRPGSNETVIVQLVEIIKKPGQSLGLYLREGNGYDRFSGVFASRFGENSELERYGDILKPGDEILTVNNVDVSQMAIDDVVLILSIPRRLLLRICYPKNRRENNPRSMQDRERPVVVVHKRDDTRSGVTDNSGGLLSRPPTTASTWLGKRVRQQKQDMLYGSMQRMSAPTIPDPYGMPSTSRHYEEVPKPVGMTSPRQQYAPRLLDSQGKPILNDHGSIAATAVVPPPKMRPKQPAYSSATLGRMPSTSNDPFRRPLRPSLVQTDPSRSTHPSPYSNPTAPIYPDPYAATSSSAATAIGLPSTSTASGPFSGSNVTSAYKSNSLPRRRVQSGAIGTLPRTVKWRNDVVDGPQGRSAMSDVEDFTYLTTDSSGFTSDPLRNRKLYNTLSSKNERF